MNLFYAILLLLLGLAVLVKGADWLVDGAVAIARQLGMSPLIIGLTIVAMGTSAPEVAASIAAVLANADPADLAVGNVYGSNVANLALVGGVCALIRPILVTRAALVRDLPIMLAAMLLLYGLLGDLALGRGEAVLMLLVFAGVIVFLIRSERRRARENEQLLLHQEKVVEQAVHHPPQRLGTSVLLLVIGLAALAGGAKIMIFSAEYLGVRAGLSPAVIGSTIVAVATSLPELITCLVAAVKGHDDLSVGNLVGSNIFNTLLVIGAAGIVRPFSVSPTMIGLDWGLMIAVSALFAAVAMTFKKINRPAGVVLTLCYLGYMGYQFALTR